MSTRHLLAALVLLASACAGPADHNPAESTRDAPAELILTGGKIAIHAEGPEFVEALAVRDGLVLAAGSAAEVARHAGPATRVLALAGRTVIPGLNDSHAHVVRGGRFYNLELRWDGVATLAEALARVREQAARTPPAQWVRVVGAWSPYQFAERRMPTVAELNAAAPDVPVFVLFLYSQGFLNAAGVRALGLGPDSVPPAGGAYRFVDGGAELLAVPHPAILYQTVGKLPELAPEDQLNSTLHFYRELNRFGLTSAVDAGGGGHAFPEDYAASERLAREGRMPLRVSMYLFPQKPGSELADLRAWTAAHALGEPGAADLRHGYELDGAGENLVWSAGDFENFLAPRPALADAMERELGDVVRELVLRRWPFRIHATYGESIERMLGVFEAVDRAHPFAGLRWLVDHAETIRPEQIERIRRLGGGVAIQNRMAFAGEFFQQRYGAEAAAQAPPLRRLVDSGLPLGAGTDATRVSSHNPWLALYWMVSGKTVGGTLLYGLDNRLTRAEALALYTHGSAWVAGEEDVKGTLAPGRYADLAVLSADYYSVPEEEIRRIESVLTVVGGQIVYAAGPYAGLAPALPPPSPDWSPVARFGGYAR